MDWYSDLQYAENQYIKNFSAIQSAMNSALTAHNTANVVFTGHSLGGMLAQRAAVNFADDVKNLTGGDVGLITYDAPPIAYDAGSSSYIDSAIHYYVEGSLVPRLGDGSYVSGQETSIYEINYTANIPTVANLHNMAAIQSVIATGDIRGLTFLLKEGSSPSGISTITTAHLQNIISNNGESGGLTEQEAGLRLVDALLQLLGHTSTTVTKDAYLIAKAILPLNFLADLGFAAAQDIAYIYNNQIGDDFRGLISNLNANTSDLTFSEFMTQAASAAPTDATKAVVYWQFLDFLLPKLESINFTGFENIFTDNAVHNYVETKMSSPQYMVQF